MDILLYMARVAQYDLREEPNTSESRKPNFDFEVDFEELEKRNVERSQEFSAEDEVVEMSGKGHKRSSIFQARLNISKAGEMNKSEEIFAIALDVSS